jgi:multiple sugar transport system substrate-binding protein
VFYPGSEETWPAVQGEIQQTIGKAVQKGADIAGILAAIEAKTK